MTSSVLKRKILLAACATPGAFVLAFFFLLPLGVIAYESLGSGGVGFFSLMADREFWFGLRNSVVLGLAAGVISVVVGSIVAFQLASMREKTRMLLLFVIALPLTFSGLIVAYGFILGFGRSGFITLSLAAIFGIDPAAFAGFVYSPQGLAFVYSYYLIPRVVMLLVPVLVNFDHNQVAAAQSMGASSFRATADIILPQVMPTIIVSFCLVVAVAVGAYGTALALVGTQVNILPLQLFTAISDVNTNFQKTAALAMILTLVCSCVMAIGEAVASSSEKRGHNS